MLFEALQKAKIKRLNEFFKNSVLLLVAIFKTILKHSKPHTGTMSAPGNGKIRDDIRKSYWKEEEEDLLRSWADKAQCYQWIHMKSREVYRRRNARYTIPVIIISTFVGTASFAQDRFSEENRQYVAMGVGTLSIVAGIISTVAQFLKVSELNEAHRISALSWGKFFRAVKTEISRHPLDRQDPATIIDHSKEEFDRLVEISPPIPKKVLDEFKQKFSSIEGLVKPEVCDELSPTAVFDISEMERAEIIENLQATNKHAEQKVKHKAVRERERTLQDEYRATFFGINGRYPNDFEMRKYLQTDAPDSGSEGGNSIRGADDGVAMDMTGAGAAVSVV